MSAPAFQMRVRVRMYEVDRNGHLNGSVYVQYADQARWELARAAGVTPERLVEQGVGPVNLETTIRYHRELRLDDEVSVSAVFVWGEGKTFRVEQGFRTAAGTVAADVVSVVGMLDLERRRLLSDPRAVWRSLATEPERLGV